MIKLKKELRKYKHIWPVLYVFIYMPWFIMLEKNISADYPGLHILHCPLDDMIPFCEWFVIPYLLWFLYKRKGRMKEIYVIPENWFRSGKGTMHMNLRE